MLANPLGRALSCFDGMIKLPGNPSSAMKTILISILILTALLAVAWWLAPKLRPSKKPNAPATIPRTTNPDTASIPKGPISDEEFRGLIQRLSLPGLLLQGSPGPTNSYLGGMPPADLETDWPRWKGRPLGFLACIRLADIGDTLPWLPQHGRLLFFYDLEETPWGFDPADRGSWQVIHLPGDGNASSVEPPADLSKEHRIPIKHLRFKKAELPPTWDHAALDHVELTDSQGDWLEEHRDSLIGENDARHQMGSYPSAVQSADMETECQLASNGLYLGDATGYNDPRAAELKEGASDWRLLLQIDSDDDVNLMWGDVGMIYFWAREQDARAGDFSRTWLILQCH